MVTLLIDVVEGEGAELGKCFSDIGCECLQGEGVFAIKDPDLVIDNDLEMHN